MWPYSSCGHLRSWVPTNCRGSSVRRSPAPKEDQQAQGLPSLVDQVKHWWFCCCLLVIFLFILSAVIWNKNSLALGFADLLYLCLEGCIARLFYEHGTRVLGSSSAVMNILVAKPGFHFTFCNTAAYRLTCVWLCMIFSVVAIVRCCSLLMLFLVLPKVGVGGL